MFIQMERVKQPVSLCFLCFLKFRKKKQKRQKVINIHAQTLLAHTGAKAPVSEATARVRGRQEDCSPGAPGLGVHVRTRPVQHPQVRKGETSK